jgi:hypothetical protein
VITANVVLRACTQVSDCGSIYVDMRNTGYSIKQNVTISNNFIRDAGSGSNGGHDIYLDDDSSNVTITGNILGPSANADGDHSLLFMNGGSANNVQNNVLDTGFSATGGPNVAANNHCGDGGTISCSGA